MKTVYALAAAALVLTGAADPAEITISGDRILGVTAQGLPARLRVDPGAPTTPLFTPEFAARAGFRAGWIGFQARVGPVRVPGYTAVIRLDYGDGESKRRIGWFDGPYVAGADGGIGPGALSADRVRFVIGPPMPGERSLTLPLANFGRAGMGVYLIVNGERILTRFSLNRDFSIATAAAGATIAASNGGRFDADPAHMVIHLGVDRPVRHMALAAPLTIGPLSLTGILVRTGDFGSAASIPEGEVVESDPDEIVVVGAKKRKGEQRLEIGRDYLDRCSSIVFDKRAKLVTLSCR